MKRLSFDQMESVSGGIDVCAVAQGVTAVGGGLMLCGATLCPVSLAIYAGIAVYGGMC